MAARDEEEFVSYTLALAADEPGIAGIYFLTGTSSVPEQFIKLIHLCMKPMRIAAMACRQIHPHEQPEVVLLGTEFVATSYLRGHIVASVQR